MQPVQQSLRAGAVHHVGPVLQLDPQLAARGERPRSAGSAWRRSLSTPTMPCAASRSVKVSSSRKFCSTYRLSNSCRRRTPAARWMSPRPRYSCAHQLEPVGLDCAAATSATGSPGSSVTRAGHGVEEQCRSTVVDAGELGGAAGDGGAEHDVLAAGRVREHQRQRGAEHRVEGDARAAGLRGEPRGQLLGRACKSRLVRQHRARCPRPPGSSSVGSSSPASAAAHAPRDASRSWAASQAGSRRTRRLAAAGAACPPRPRRARTARAAPARGTSRPTAGSGSVNSSRSRPPGSRTTVSRASGGAARSNGAEPVGGGQLRPGVVEVGGRRVGQVDHVEPRTPGPRDRCDRSRQAVGDEADRSAGLRSQHRRVRGGAAGRCRGGRSKSNDVLRDVDVGGAGEAGLEVQALLQRRQRPDVVDAGVGAAAVDPVDLVLVTARRAAGRTA